MPDLKTIYDSAEVPADFKHALGLQAVWDAGFKMGAEQKPAEPPVEPEKAIVYTDDAGNPIPPPA